MSGQQQKFWISVLAASFVAAGFAGMAKAEDGDAGVRTFYMQTGWRLDEREPEGPRARMAEPSGNDDHSVWIMARLDAPLTLAAQETFRLVLPDRTALMDGTFETRVRVVLYDENGPVMQEGERFVVASGAFRTDRAGDPAGIAADEARQLGLALGDGEDDAGAFREMIFALDPALVGSTGTYTIPAGHALGLHLSVVRKSALDLFSEDGMGVANTWRETILPGAHGGADALYGAWFGEEGSAPENCEAQLGESACGNLRRAIDEPWNVQLIVDDPDSETPGGSFHLGVNATHRVLAQMGLMNFTRIDERVVNPLPVSTFSYGDMSAPSRLEVRTA